MFGVTENAGVVRKYFVWKIKDPAGFGNALKAYIMLCYGYVS